MSELGGLWLAEGWDSLVIKSVSRNKLWWISAEIMFDFTPYWFMYIPIISRCLICLKFTKLKIHISFQVNLFLPRMLCTTSRWCHWMRFLLVTLHARRCGYESAFVSDFCLKTASWSPGWPCERHLLMLCGNPLSRVFMSFVRCVIAVLIVLWCWGKIYTPCCVTHATGHTHTLTRCEHTPGQHSALLLSVVVSPLTLESYLSCYAFIAGAAAHYNRTHNVLMKCTVSHSGSKLKIPETKTVFTVRCNTLLGRLYATTIGMFVM